MSHADWLSPKYQLEEKTDALTFHWSDSLKIEPFNSHDANPDAKRLTEAKGCGGDIFSSSSKVYISQKTTARGPLYVGFLGGFELHYDGTPLPVCHYVKPLSILKYLLACREHPVSRDFLMGWLWPESNQRKARWSLNSSVCTLRRFLSDYLPTEQIGEIVLYEEGSYRLNPNLLIKSDVEDFDKRYIRSRRLEEAGNINQAAMECEAAVELYRGDYLQEDLYEDWTMVERERLANAYIHMLEHLATYCWETGRYQQAVEICYLILKKEPCHEGTHRRLIDHYNSLGLRERSLRQSQMYARMLKDRYGVLPSSADSLLP